MKYKHILPTMGELQRETMRFRILDGNNSNVLGEHADVPIDNAAFLGLEEIIQHGCDNLKIRRLTDLEPHQSAQCRFRMSGTTGVYKVLRVLSVALLSATALNAAPGNWAGYVQSSPNVSYVQGTFTIPWLVGDTPGASVMFWVGIDGWSSSTVEQIGIGEDDQGGSFSLYAFYEVYPQPAQLIPNMNLAPGDSVTCAVQYLGNSNFMLAMTNNTTGNWFAVTNQCKTTKRTSAEWIVEAPQVVGTGGAMLADFDSVTFTNCASNVSATVQPVTMQTKKTVKAVPSGLAGGSFSVQWEHE